MRVTVTIRTFSVRVKKDVGECWGWEMEGQYTCIRESVSRGGGGICVW